MQNEIKCPKCGTAFEVDKSKYAEILQQVRTKEFDEELKKQEKFFEEQVNKENVQFQSRLEQEKKNAETQLKSALALTEEKIRSESKDELALKDREIAEQQSKILALEEANKSSLELTIERLKSNYEGEIAKLKQEIQGLGNQIDSSEMKKQLEISSSTEKIKSELEDSLASKDKIIAEQQLKINAIEAGNKSNLELIEERAKKAYEKKIAELQQQVLGLENQINSNKLEKQLEISKITNEVEKELQDAKNKLELANSQKINEIVAIEDKHRNEIKLKDETIDFYKDFKAKQSVKLLGESLEQHCEIAFNQLRATAFRTATFEKDNDSSSGTKGDYIYRELDQDGVELISIMFEMKNEQDETVTKSKNEDFFSKLDKDRKNKNCEYAVLVSVLEADNELYNTGIVDVSYGEYEKMYVIRPQFFIPMITLLRNAAENALQYKQEIALLKNQSIDVSKFEAKLKNAQESFDRSFGYAHDRYDDAIKGIDDTIKRLTKIRENLVLSEDHYSRANRTLGDITIKKLVHGNPTMRAKFAELDSNVAFIEEHE